MHRVNFQILSFPLVYKFLRILFILCSIFEYINALNLASSIGLLRSNDRFVWVKTNFNPSKRDCSELKGACQQRADTEQQVCLMMLFDDVALVLARPCRPETILFRWMKIETTQLLFVQSMLNRSSDLSGHVKLAKFRLFIYSKLEPKINKPYGNLYISGKPRV